VSHYRVKGILGKAPSVPIAGGNSGSVIQWSLWTNIEVLLNPFAVGVHLGFGEIKSCIFHIASEICEAVTFVLRGLTCCSIRDTDS
jgi:hypothetical protein